MIRLIFISLLLPLFAMAAPADHPGRKSASPATDKKPAASTHDGKKTSPSGKKQEKKQTPSVDLSTRGTGSVVLAGKMTDYEIETDTITLFNGKDEATAKVFYAFYRKVPADTKRPIMFCFNGGPGSSAVWLHLGGLGPRRVALPDDGTTSPRPPFHLEDNPDCVLDAADLVFVDPVGTGFSRPEKGKQTKEFTGLNTDVDYLADFIRRFIDKHDRWNSPKFLLGESYGALRVAGLAEKLQSRYGLYLNGAILLSGLLDFRTLSTSGGNDLPHQCFLPSMATTAAYHTHGKEKLDYAKIHQQARDFAFGDYALALLAGNKLPKEQEKIIADKLAQMTETPAQLWLDANLRLPSSVFRKQLLADKHTSIGRFDARVTAPSRDALSPHAAGDPSFDLAWGAFSTSINAYLRGELKTSAPHSYEVLNGRVGPWDYGTKNGFARMDNQLATAMRRNPHLRVLVQCGHFDLATPPEGILFSLAQMDLPEKLQVNLSVAWYPGGHMFYLSREASGKMRRDLLAFLKQE